MSVSRAGRVVDISVIIATYNRGPVLQQTLECVLQQRPAPREIIVVDQSEQHADSVRQYIDDLRQIKRIRYIQQREPNAQRARNRAICEATGEVLLFLDDDVLMGTDLVANHWKNYRNDPDLVAVGGFRLELGGEPEPVDTLPEACLEPVTGWMLMPHSYNRRVEGWHLLPTCNCSIKRSVAIRMGGFDENYRYSRYDDTDFSCRLKALGVKSIHDPNAALVHLKEPTGGRRPADPQGLSRPNRAMWYTWCYFYGSNFSLRYVVREIAGRLRGHVFNRYNVLRPWRLVPALTPAIAGGAQALVALSRGRRLISHRTFS